MGIKRYIDVCVPFGKTSKCTGEMALAVKFVPFFGVLSSKISSKWEWLTGIYSKFQFHLGKCSHMSHWTSNSKQNCSQREKLKVSLQVAEFLFSVRGSMIDMAGTCNIHILFVFLRDLQLQVLEVQNGCQIPVVFLPVVSFQYCAWIWIYCNPACFVILGGAEKILCHCSSG